MDYLNWYTKGAMILIVLCIISALKIRGDHYKSKLDALEVSYNITQGQIKYADKQNAIIKTEGLNYQKKISDTKVSDSCQYSLDFIVAEMKRFE